MSKKKYTVKFYKGDYTPRQLAANKDEAICYIEHHFNSTSKKVQTTADYAMCIVGRNASQTSIKWAKLYSKLIDKEFEEIIRVGGVDGVLVGGWNGRGDGNVRKTAMPAILVEPMFCNDPDHATVMKTVSGQERLAQCLVDSIKKTFPKGGLVAFSIGHLGKTTNKKDKGAPIHGGGWEGNISEKVLKIAKTMLEDE